MIAQKILKKSLSYQPYQIYLSLITLTGVSLVAWGIFQLPSYEPQNMFILVLLLGAFSEFTTTSVQISEKAGITYDVGTTVSMAAIPLFGPMAATVVIAAINLGIWLIKPKDKTTWKKSWSQLGFNLGMHSIAILTASFVYLIVRSWLPQDSWMSHILPWLPAGIAYDQVNFWLLMGILKLQHGAQFNPLEMWQQNRWAMIISISLKSIGGGILAFASARFGILGVVSFFLPILLSAYAFRLYVSQIRDHMDKLETMVAERTKELAARTEKLAQLDKQKDEFLAVLSHDMKTSLTGIRVYASLMQEFPTLIADEPQVAEDIMDNLTTLTSLVDNILDLEKLDSNGSLALQCEPFDLNLSVGKLIKAMKALAIKKEIIIHHAPHPTAVLIDADQGQIERVMLNLISNAIKYTPRRGEVFVTVTNGGNQASVEIRDTGYGIPEKELPHIFERFNRVEHVTSLAAGTGLGLAIAKAIIEAHGGEIAVSSYESKGSIFTVILPYASLFF